MNEQEIKSDLCYYDPENPNNNLGAFDDEDRPQPRNKCSCDNCFYGRDKLAMQLLEARRERDEAREVNAKLRDIAERAINYLDQSYRDGFSDEVSDFRYELEQLKEETK